MELRYTAFWKTKLNKGERVGTDSGWVDADLRRVEVWKTNTESLHTPPEPNRDAAVN